MQTKSLPKWKLYAAERVPPCLVAWLLARPFMRVVLRLVFHILAPVRITGKKNVPRGKPYIVAINHVSLFDPPFAGVFWPEQVEVMGAVEVWSRPGQNILARLWGGIPVHRGDYDRAMFETVLAVLRSGYPLLIAPEGGRSHVPGLRVAKPGIAYLAEQSGCRSSRLPLWAPPMISGTRPSTASVHAWKCISAVRSNYLPWKAKARLAGNPASVMPTWSCATWLVCCPRNTAVSTPITPSSRNPKPVSKIWRPDLTHLPTLDDGAADIPAYFPTPLPGNRRYLYENDRFAGWKIIHATRQRWSSSTTWAIPMRSWWWQPCQIFQK